MWPRKESQRPGRSAGCACQKRRGCGRKEKQDGVLTSDIRVVLGRPFGETKMRGDVDHETFVGGMLLVAAVLDGLMETGEARGGCGKKPTQKPSSHLSHRPRA